MPASNLLQPYYKEDGSGLRMKGPDVSFDVTS